MKRTVKLPTLRLGDWSIVVRTLRLRNETVRRRTMRALGFVWCGRGCDRECWRYGDVVVKADRRPLGKGQRVSDALRSASEVEYRAARQHVHIVPTRRLASGVVVQEYWPIDRKRTDKLLTKQPNLETTFLDFHDRNVGWRGNRWRIIDAGRERHLLEA